jgi:hypothetical protein
MRNSGRNSQRENRDADGARDIHGAGGLRAAAQARDQGEKQRKAQILKQTNSHGEPAMGAVVLRLLGELRNDDCRRRHGYGAADHHRHRRGDIESQDGSRRNDAGGDEHLRAAHAEHFPAHRHQARQGEFQSQGKYQEHHAEVRQQSGRLVVGRERERVRSEQHADCEVSQNRRQLELAHSRHHAHRGGEQDQDLQQRIVMMHDVLLAYSDESKYDRPRAQGSSRGLASAP